MTGQFVASFTLAFIGGFILAFPYVFWEFWKFIRPALSPKELKKTRGIIFWVSLLFFAVFFLVISSSPHLWLNFYFNYKLSPQIVIMPSFSDSLENLVYTTPGIRGIVSDAATGNGCIVKDWNCNRNFFKEIQKACFYYYINCYCQLLLLPQTPSALPL